MLRQKTYDAISAVLADGEKFMDLPAKTLAKHKVQSEPRPDGCVAGLFLWGAGTLSRPGRPFGGRGDSSHERHTNICARAAPADFAAIDEALREHSNESAPQREQLQRESRQDEPPEKESPRNESPQSEPHP